MADTKQPTMAGGTAGEAAQPVTPGQSDQPIPAGQENAVLPQVPQDAHTLRAQAYNQMLSDPFTPSNDIEAILAAPTNRPWEPAGFSPSPVAPEAMTPLLDKLAPIANQPDAPAAIRALYQTLAQLAYKQANGY